MSETTIGAYFAKFREGKIWPAPGLKVQLDSGKYSIVVAVLPSYSCNKGAGAILGIGQSWDLNGRYFRYMKSGADIISIIDNAGNHPGTPS